MDNPVISKEKQLVLSDVVLLHELQTGHAHSAT